MKNVSIIGAGLVGSLWALYMAKRGYRVDVYERRPDMRKLDLDGGRSINLAMSDRGLKALAGVGLEEEVRKMAIPMLGRMIHHMDGSTQLQPYGLKGQYINSISRAGLNSLLMDKAEEQGDVRFHFNHRCEEVDLDAKEVLLENEQGERVTIDSDLVFGTDGAFSAIRGSMLKQGRFNYAQEYLEHGYKELTIPPTEDGGFRLHKNALHIWPRKSFMLIALPNMDGSFTCTLFLAFEGVVSFDKLQTEEDVEQFFEEYFPDAVEHLPELTTQFFGNPTSSLVTVRCFPWSAADKFLLMGDASHAIVPFYGQGMNAGFEDCTVLNDTMEQHGEDWSTILKQFERTRKPDADAIADLAYRNFIEMRDLVADEQFVLRKKLEKAIHKKYPEQFKPLYAMVTFTHMPYAEALQLGEQHDKFFENLPDLEERVAKLDTAEGNQVLDQTLSELNAFIQ